MAMNTKISEKTINKVNETLSEIQMNHPEAYKLLDEDPITLISDTNPRHTEVLLKTYLEGLNALLNSLKQKLKADI